MAQYKMNAYDADVFIPRFKGLISNGNDPDGDLQYAVEAENVDTTDGFLQPAADPGYFIMPLEQEAVRFEEQITSGRSQQGYERRLLWFTGETYDPDDERYVSHFREVARVEIDPGFEISGMDSKPMVYIYTSGNAIGCKYRIPNYYVYGILDTRFYIHMDGTIDNTYREYASGDPPETDDAHWEIVTYQNVNIAGLEYYPTSILLSSKEKGLYVIQFTRQVGAPYVGIELSRVETPVRFEHIEAFGERLWGCSSTEDKETLYYSAIYNPIDWKLNTEHPELGAGQIDQPNWDGDEFTGLKKFGDSLIAFKTHRAFKVSGVDIASMYITEQFGFGTEFGKTIVSSGTQLYFANRSGLAVYDGTTVRQLMQDNLRGLWDKIRSSAMGEMRGFLCENRKYCLSVPVDSDINNTLIVLDTLDGSVLFYKDMFIRGFCHPTTEQSKLVLWNDGKESYIRELRFNAWDKNVATNRATKWITPWLELGRKDIQKGGFDFYFTPEVKGNNPVTFTITFQTEKKKKTKQYTVQPMTAEELAADKKGKTKRIHFGGSGRRFRLILETAKNANVIWRLYGGIHIIAETDKD